MPDTLVILGGYGAAGLAIARLLLQETDCRLALAGRHVQKAEDAARDLNAHWPGQRVHGVYADAALPDTLDAHLAAARLLIVCATSAAYTGPVARHCLAAGCDYFDINYPQSIVPVLEALAPAMRAAGRCFISQGGVHPGLPAALVRYAAPYFTRYRSAVVGMAFSQRSLGTHDAVQELVSDWGNTQGSAWERGRWRRYGLTETKKLSFGRGFGTRHCAPLELVELRTLPEQYGLEELGLFVSGFNWFTDWVVFPLIMGAGLMRKNLGVAFLTRLLRWGMATFSRPPWGALVTLQAQGLLHGRPQEVTAAIYHEDGYVLTAIPAVACLLQYLDGAIARPGLWWMGQAVEPERLLRDMQRLGAAVDVTVREPLPGPVAVAV